MMLTEAAAEAAAPAAAIHSSHRAIASRRRGPRRLTAAGASVTDVMTPPS
jgi:hypothetical protein